MKKISILALAFILAIGLYSCSENPTVVEDNSYELTILADAPISENVEMGTLVDASIETEMNYSLGTEMMMNPTPTNVMIPLGGVLRQLNLTTEQLANVKVYAREYYDCITRAQKALRIAEEAIVKRANAARREVLAKLKSGEITREQAARQIANINKIAREAMQNSEARKAALAQIKDCLKAYIDKIKLILTDTQLAKFIELLRKMNSDVSVGTGTRG